MRKRRGRPRGSGFFNKVLDKPFTARQAIRGAKALPSTVKSITDDIAGAGMTDGLVKIPRVRGVTAPIVDVPGISSGVMSGRGSRPKKGSPEMREKMRRLREMRRKSV
jgi:hypothetical protein